MLDSIYVACNEESLSAVLTTAFARDLSFRCQTEMGVPCPRGSHILFTQKLFTLYSSGGREPKKCQQGEVVAVSFTQERTEHKSENVQQTSNLNLIER